jgi:formylglycine-generating enzyme required for sulfatase activity
MNFPSGNLVGLLGEPRDEAFVRHIVEGTLKALASYHERGRSYGQVRPHTIYLAGDGRIRLGDVRATIVSTQVEAPEGLAKYLPPETLAADVFGEVGPSTDIYALGLVAIELLTGPRFETLFDGIADDPLGGDLAWMRWHGTAELRLPPVRQIVPSLSAGFAAVLDRMVAKRVADRPATAEQVMSMFAGNETVTPSSPAAASAPVVGIRSSANVDSANDWPAEQEATVVSEDDIPPEQPSDAGADETVRKTQEAATAATLYFEDSDAHVDGATHGIAPLPMWQNDVRATPKVTDTAHEDEPAAPLVAPPIAPPVQDGDESSEPPVRSQPIRGTMMPEDDDSPHDDTPYGESAAANAPIVASIVETKPVASAPKEPRFAEPRRQKPSAAGTSHPADQMPPAMKLAMKRRRGPLDHPAVLALLSLAIIAGVGYLLFVVWPIDDGTRKIEITSDPPGASVIVDGLASGEKTPAEVKIKIGKRDVRLTMDGYYDAKKSFEVVKEENPEVAFTLTKIPTFRAVRLETEPSDAAVYLDGSPTPFESRTPTEMTLSLRTHKVVFKKAGYLDTPAEINVQLGEGTHVERVTLSAMPKRTENLIVKVDPRSARLMVNGLDVPVADGKATVPIEEGSTVDLIATAEGFANWQRALSFADAEQSQLMVMAELDPFVSFLPPEATVTVNDQPLKLEAGRALFAAAPNQRYRVVASAKGYDPLEITLSRADLAGRRFKLELSPGPRPPAALRQLADGRYVHDQLEKAGAPLYFVLVEPGQFVFGASGEGIRLGELPKRPAQIDEPYLIATTEVSVKQYAIFAEQAGEQKAGKKWKPADMSAAANLPVTNVSHEQAKNFAEFVSGKLPTEQQWERAARGTKGRAFPWDGDDMPSSERCNLGFGAIAQRKLSAVDALPEGATPEGVLNMLGNAAEWCDEVYKLGHGDDGQTPGAGRFPTIRGGSYQDPYNNTSRDARATMRANSAPEGRADVGIRVVVPFVRGK